MGSATPARATRRRIFSRTDDLIGDEDVADAGSGEDLRLAELGAGDADGARRKLLADDLDGLLPFDMWTPVDAMGAAKRGDPPDIPFHDIEVDEEGWRVDLQLGGAG